MRCIARAEHLVAALGRRRATAVRLMVQQLERPHGQILTVFVDRDDGPVPMALVACTTQVYVLPRLSEVTLIGLAVPAACRLVPPLLLVQRAMYPTIEDPPSESGGEYRTTAVVRTAEADTEVGAPGAVSVCGAVVVVLVVVVVVLVVFVVEVVEVDAGGTVVVVCSWQAAASARVSSRPGRRRRSRARRRVG